MVSSLVCDLGTDGLESFMNISKQESSVIPRQVLRDLRQDVVNTGFFGKLTIVAFIALRVKPQPQLHIALKMFLINECINHL